MTMLALNRHAKTGEPRLNTVTKEQWTDALASFPSAVRGRAANLAAHNYDVTLVGERVLISTAYGGAWFDKEGKETPLERELFDKLYPIVPSDDPRYHAGWEITSALPDGSRHQTAIDETGFTE